MNYCDKIHYNIYTTGLATFGEMVDALLAQLPQDEQILRLAFFGMPNDNEQYVSRRIMLREILPNLLNILLVEAAIYFGYAILVGSGLGFLGMGVQPPSPDWGLQVSDGRNFLLTAPWVVIYPALAISSLVIGINWLADGLAITHER